MHMRTGFYIRQRAGVDGAEEHNLIRTDIASIKDIGQFSFIKSKFEHYELDYPYLRIDALPEADQYLISFHHNNDYYPMATLRDYGGNIDDDLWFKFLVEGKSFKMTRGYLYD